MYLSACLRVFACTDREQRLEVRHVFELWDFRGTTAIYRLWKLRKRAHSCVGKAMLLSLLGKQPNMVGAKRRRAVDGFPFWAFTGERIGSGGSRGRAVYR